jgi:hypothetical protein
MIPSYTARELEGMNRSQEFRVQAHFKHKNTSSTSLEGMERPVRSFKSFVQTAPPHPTETDKALPLTSAPWNRVNSDVERTPTPPSADLPLASRERSSSIPTWDAPAEWYNDGASCKSTHTTPSPPPTSAPRTFSQLLPEPSPNLLDMVEPTAWLTPTSPLASRLLPIYERASTNLDLGPPGSPPRSPLPAPPPFKTRFIENILPPEHRSTDSSPGRKAFATDCAHELSRSGSNKEKAYASLGLDSPFPNNSQELETNQRGRKRADRQYLRGKKLHALYKGSPLVDDSWEDEDMDDKTRKLSFSQDYHDLLADQYQEMNVRVQEALSTGGVQQVHGAQLTESIRSGISIDHENIPRPLSWRKGSGRSTPRSQSQDRNGEQLSSPRKKSKHTRMSSLIPHRLGSSESSQEELSKRTPGSDAEKLQDNEFRFSRFFPSTRPMKFGKKQRKTEIAKAPSAPSSSPQPSPPIHLPGGLAVARTHSPSPVPQSDILSDKSPTSTHTRRSSQFGSDYSPTASNPRSSYNSNNSPFTANIPIAMRSAYRTSGGSSYSHRSSAYHPITFLPPPPPPPPPIMPSSPPRSPLVSPEMLNRLRDEKRIAEHRHIPNFFEKAKEARRRRLTGARQDKLKRSIKVLGPTDPGVAQAGYVKSEDMFERRDSDLEGSLPGYMIGRSA